MKIGIFGGTFDPPHLGHQILAAEAQAQLELDQVLWVLTPYPPHKTNQRITSLHDRMAMVKLAIADNPYFIFSRVDIDREPPQYALDTVLILKQESPTNEFIYLMGADSLNDLLKWHEPALFVAACDGIGIMQRHGDEVDTQKLEKDLPGIAAKIYILETPRIEIAGCDIRERVSNGNQFRYLVPEKIHQYILNHKLYH
jgi:nicotinate-nucleotide adenylyltransferase